MGAYIPPSIRTIRQDIGTSVVLSGGEVVPVIIGTSNGKTTLKSAYEAELGSTESYVFSGLGAEGPVSAISEIRSLAAGGIIYEENVDFTFTSGTQTIDWSLGTTISQPYQFELVGSTTGGTLAADTYYYVVTAIKTTNETGPVVGETVVSNEQEVTTTGATSSVKITWRAIAGAEGYKIYRTTTSGDYTDKLLATVAGGFVTEYTDTGTATGTGSPPTVQTAANITGTGSETFDLEPSQTIIWQSDLGGPYTAIFTATSASHTGTGASYPVTFVASTNDELVLTLGGVQYLVTFSAGSTTLSEVLDQINAVIAAGRAVDDAGQLKIETDKRGTDAELIIGAASTALTLLGLTDATYPGGGNVGNIDAVLASEAASVIAAAGTGVTGSDPSGKVKLTRDTAGVAYWIEVTGGTANTEIGLPTTKTYGTDAEANTALKRPALNGGDFFVDYTYIGYNYFEVTRFTKLPDLQAAYGLGSNLTVAGTLIMGRSGRGQGASICLGLPIPDDNLLTYQTALDFLKIRKDVDLVVPCNAEYTVMNAVYQHCKEMSNTTNKRERRGVFGSKIGTVVGDETTSGTAIYQAKSLGHERAIYCFPWLFLDVQDSTGTLQEDVEYDGWTTAACVAGLMAALPDRAEPATTKSIQGASKLGSELDEPTMNLLGGAGVTVIEKEEEEFTVRDALTTDSSSDTLMHPNICLTDDFLRKTLRVQFKQFKGKKLLSGLLDKIEKRTKKVLSLMVKFTLIVGYDAETIVAYQDPDRLTWVIVNFSYRPVFPTRVIEFRYSFDLRTNALAA